jgi:hypothetical protein
MEENKKELIADKPAGTEIIPRDASIFFNIAKFEHSQRIARMFHEANIWPKHLNTIGDALIVMNLAERLNADPVQLAQSVYIIHGKPGLEGKLVISLVNASGKYAEPLRFEFSGAGDKDPSDIYDPGQADNPHYGCRAKTKDKASGKTVQGPKVTWEVVRSEGWLGKTGSKWKTMPELMFIYRAGSWFANIQCPEVKLGMPTTEELRDMDAVEIQQDANGTYKPVEEKVQDIKNGERDLTAYDEEEEEKVLRCDFPGCDFSTTSSTGMKRHITMSHKKKEPTQEELDKEAERERLRQVAENIETTPRITGNGFKEETEDKPKSMDEVAAESRTLLKQWKESSPNHYATAVTEIGMETSVKIDSLDPLTVDALLERVQDLYYKYA